MACCPAMLSSQRMLTVIPLYVWNALAMEEALVLDLGVLKLTQETCFFLPMLLTMVADWYLD
jgi:hypothetical protein